MKTEEEIRKEMNTSLDLAEHFKKHEISGKIQTKTGEHELPPKVMATLHKIRADAFAWVLDEEE